MPKTPKKIRFVPNDYKSETVFSKLSSCSKKDKPKKRRKQVSSDDDYEPRDKLSHSLKSRKPTPYKANCSKKRKSVTSHSDDSFHEDLTHNISPSKSETSCANGINLFGKEASPIEISSDIEESNDSFSFSNFFYTRDHSLNESITEAHSGIDYEFVSDGIKKVKICGKQIFDLESNSSSDAQSITRMSRESIGAIEVENRFKNSVKTVPKTEEVSVQVDSNELKSNSREKSPNVSQLNSKYLENIHSEESDLIDSLPNDISIIETEPKVTNGLLMTPKRNGEAGISKYYEVKDEQMVLLKENCSLCFFGLFSLRVLHGTVEVLGCVLDKYSKEINLYSPRGSALLALKNVTINDEGGTLSEIFPKLKENKHLKELVKKKTTAILQYSKVDEGCLKCTEKYVSQQIFPKLGDIQTPRVIFEPEDNWNVISENPLWDEVLNSVTTSTKLLVTGGKGVGKSTFIKYAINKLLNQYEQIRVVDLDPGQPEFTVPGCISVLTITEPICGPNYTHLRKAQRSYLSNINVGRDPNLYLKTIKLLMKELDSKQNVPALINYMGFTQGIGLNIVSSAITYILPTDVVQISSQISKKNFNKDLTLDTVRERCDLFGGDPSNVNFNLHELTSMNDDNTGWTLEPRQAREMCVLSYMGQMMPDGVSSLVSCKLPMYEIGLDSIKIVDADGSEISPAAVNANLVALCSMETSSRIFHCLGYGIVRGIDMTSKILVLMTPEAPDVLEDVFYLVMNGVCLPPSVYMTTDGITGNIPYVMEGELISLGQITKRSYVPVNKK